MEQSNDMTNIEKYVTKEMENEKNYKERFQVSNHMMAKNQNNLMSSLTAKMGARGPDVYETTNNSVYSKGGVSPQRSGSQMLT